MVWKRLTGLIFVFAVVSSAGATVIDFDGLLVEIEYWAGSGSNEAVVVIDFGTDSYAFGYKWDGGTTYGKDLMDAVAGAGSFGYTESGGFLNTISYDTYSNVGENGWPADWWSYFTSTDGQSWALADVGFALRELSDGDWDGWAHQTTADWPPAHLPVTPIPEPAAIALLGLGALLLRKRGTATTR